MVEHRREKSDCPGNERLEILVVVLLYLLVLRHGVRLVCKVDGFHRGPNSDIDVCFPSGSDIFQCRLKGALVVGSSGSNRGGDAVNHPSECGLEVDINRYGGPARKGDK